MTYAGDSFLDDWDVFERTLLFAVGTQDSYMAGLVDHDLGILTTPLDCLGRNHVYCVGLWYSTVVALL